MWLIDGAVKVRFFRQVRGGVDGSRHDEIFLKLGASPLASYSSAFREPAQFSNLEPSELHSDESSFLN